MVHRITAETATGEQVIFDVEPERKLVLALEDNGVDIFAPVRRRGEMHDLPVDVMAGDPGEIGDAERDILATKSDLNERTRLSCQIRVIDALTIKVIRQASVEGIAAGTRPAE